MHTIPLPGAIKKDNMYTQTHSLAINAKLTNIYQHDTKTKVHKILFVTRGNIDNTGIKYVVKSNVMKCNAIVSSRHFPFQLLNPQKDKI